MTAKKMMMPQTWLEGEQSVGFRIGPNGEVEVMTKAETEAVVKRAIREAMYSAGWRGSGGRCIDDRPVNCQPTAVK